MRRLARKGGTGLEQIDALAEEDAPGGLPPALVVVPALNEAASIEPCLRSILAGPGMKAVPVAVYDGGSTDETARIVRQLMAEYPNLSLRHNPRRSQAAAVNDAASAQGDAAVIVRCDAHAIYPPGFVPHVRSALQARGAQSLAVVMDAAARPGAGPFARANALCVDTPVGSGGSAHRGGRRSGWVDHGHHAGLSVSAFREVGGYDEDLVANEDAEYDTRLRQAGGRVWLEASIRVTYFVRETPKALWRQYHAYGRGRAAHLKRHGVRPRVRQAVPAAHVLLGAGSLALAPVLPWALLYPGAYGAGLVAVSVSIAATRRDAAGLLAFLPLAVMHCAWGTGFWRGLVVR